MIDAVATKVAMGARPSPHRGVMEPRVSRTAIIVGVVIGLLASGAATAYIVVKGRTHAAINTLLTQSAIKDYDQKSRFFNALKFLNCELHVSNLSEGHASSIGSKYIAVMLQTPGRNMQYVHLLNREGQQLDELLCIIDWCSSDIGSLSA